MLFEHATGYALFNVKEFEEVGMMIPEVEASIADVASFKSVVSLLSFHPFKSGANALDNCNSVSEGLYILFIRYINRPKHAYFLMVVISDLLCQFVGIVHDDLKLFLQTNVKPTKKDKIILGISDSKLGAAINEELGFSCQHTGVVPEIIRGKSLTTIPLASA